MSRVVMPRARRTADFHRFADGSGILTAYLTAEAAEYVHTVFDALGKPKPATAGRWRGRLAAAARRARRP